MRTVLLDNDSILAEVDFEIGLPVLHMTLHKGLTHNLLKYIKNVFMEDLMVTLGVFGYEIILVIVPEEKTMIIKSAEAIGFEKERVVDGWMYLAQDIM